MLERLTPEQWLKRHRRFNKVLFVMVVIGLYFGITRWKEVMRGMPNEEVAIISVVLTYFATRMIGYFSCGGLHVNTRPTYDSTGRRVILITSYSARFIDIRLMFEVYGVINGANLLLKQKTENVGCIDKPQKALFKKQVQWELLVPVPEEVIPFIGLDGHKVRVVAIYVNDFTNQRSDRTAEIKPVAEYC